MKAEKNETMEALTKKELSYVRGGGEPLCSGEGPGYINGVRVDGIKEWISDEGCIYHTYKGHLVASQLTICP